MVVTVVRLTRDQAWARTQAALDGVWGVDAERTIVLLNGFLSEFPGDPAAQEKLYAALFGAGVGAAQEGSNKLAAEWLTRATELLPDRGEALVALRALSPSPTVAPPNPTVIPARAPTATPVRAVVVPVPTPVPPRPAATPVPTPTKVPFAPPTRGDQ